MMHRPNLQDHHNTRLRRMKLLIGAGLLASSALAWWASLHPVDEMGMSPHLLPGSLAFIGTWTMMMSAMMLPSVLPAVWLLAVVAGSRAQLGFRPGSMLAFVAGYLTVWSATGLGVTALDGLAPAGLEAERQWIIGGALTIAGIYQLTHWKLVCLGHCRSPLHFFMEHWRDGTLGALYMGARHGMYCLACCWGFMLALIALGMMNPLWMALTAVAITAEKVLPNGDRLAPWIGVILIAAGAAVTFGWIPLPPLRMEM